MKTRQALDVKVAADGMTVRLQGEIDHHRAALLRCEIDEHIRMHRPSVMRLDASDVSFMDSSGLGLIMGRYALMQKMGGELILCEPSTTVLRMVKLSGMERIIKIETKEK